MIDSSQFSTPSLSRVQSAGQRAGQASAQSAGQKSDADKSILNDQTADPNIQSEVHESGEKNEEIVHEELSTRAKIGEKIFDVLRDGGAVGDELVVEVVAEAIGRVQPGAGWILLNFPRNINQYRFDFGNI